jgi:hypothetical protein
MILKCGWRKLTGKKLIIIIANKSLQLTIFRLQLMSSMSICIDNVLYSINIDDMKMIASKTQGHKESHISC